MSYPDSVRYLYALGNELKVGAKFGLERMQTVLKALGNPERGQQFIHVAGTNGKGSTCATISSVLRHAGMRTGLFTSPHLKEPTERIQINGQAVSSTEFAEAFDTVHAVAEDLVEGGSIDAHPSYFETVTAMSLLLFRERAEVSVIEVGLGGRLDATNVITPELCVITPVSYDHESFLGNSLSSIAGEKAGILKRGVPLILARQEPEAEAEISRRALELECEVTRTTDVEIASPRISANGSLFSLDGVEYYCALAGRHQLENAIAAVLACQRLGVETEAIQTGLKNVYWPGRLELVARKPDFILDGAHNPAGALALAQYIREFYTGRPVWMVYGAMRDKAIEEVTEQLFPLAERLILTAPGVPRALRPEAILEMAGHSNATPVDTISEAIALARTASARTAVFFTGSLFLVGEARGLLVS